MNATLLPRIRWFFLGILLAAGTGLSAAPLAWFPGPPAGTAFSGGVAVADASLGTVIIGGDNLFSPENLVATNSSWRYLPGFGSVQIAPGAVDSGDYIIVYGGTDGTASLSTVIGYSPSGDGNLTEASMSVPRSYLGYAADRSGNAYAIGGLDASSNALSSAERYSQEGNSWSAITAMPAPRYNFPAVFDHTNEIYIFGGYTDTVSGVESSDALYFSTAKNTWTAIASLPVAVAGSTAAFGADGKIYVVGGTSGGVPTDIVQVYTPGANSWAISTPLPEALTALAMSVDSLGRLITVGGMDTNANDVADVWRSQQLGVPDSPPSLTQFPLTNAVYGQPYTSVIAATGNPQPTYQIASGPAGMSVDTYSGVITWTPLGVAQVGNIPVTIQATNFAGSTNWNFSITVPPPPPVTPTNLTVVSVNDNSVTLSWAPESPEVGPVIYKVYRITSGGAGHGIYSLYASNSANTVTIALPTAGAIYEFVVTATASGHTTGYSYEIGVVTTAPQAPPNIRITALTSTSFSLAWDSSPGPAQSPNYSAIAGYAISKYIPSYGSYTLIPTVSPIPTNVTSGTVSGLTPGTGAFWIVQSFDSQGYYSGATINILGINNPVPAAAQMNITPQFSGGNFQFSATEGGSILQTVLIEATTNPADPNSWQQIGSVFPSSNPLTFTDTNASQYPYRFYRVISP